MKNYWQLGATLDLGIYPRNTEIQFSTNTDLDTEERFRKNPSLTWQANSFTYKYNSHGFRSREFDLKDKNIIMAFGCSHTCGVGVPYYDNWPEQFGRTYFSDHVVYNAGLGGASADTVARLALNMIPIIKPKIVTVMWPSQYRFETYENGAVFNGAWTMEEDNLQYENNTSYNNQTKNKAILELLQKVYQFKLLTIDWDDTVQKVYNTVNWTKGRDGVHFGPDWHQQMAYDFYLQYSNHEDFILKYTDPKTYWKKYKDKDIK